MTTAHQSTNSLSSSSVSDARAHQRRSDFWPVCALLSLSSLLISLYALFLSSHLAPAASQHDLDEATLAVAHELAGLSVVHNRFGNVGLVSADGGKDSRIGLNYLQATLRLDGIIARQMGYDGMLELVGKDACYLARLSSRLAHLQRQLAEPSRISEFAGNEPFVLTVRRALARTGSGGRLRSLKLELGALKKTAGISSSTPLPALSGEGRSFFADGVNYLPHVSVPIWEDINYQFYELAEKAKIVSDDFFVPLKSADQVASVVRVQADFEVFERGGKRRLRRMISCAVVGAPSPPKPSLVFMISFPQGYVARYGCFNDLFSPSNFSGSSGRWLQAAGAEIPSHGHFEPAPLPTMPAHEAAMVAFYHFLQALGPEVVPDNLRLLAKESFSSVPLRASRDIAGSGAFNSGLFKDTGAARFALEKQSSKNGSGQRALRAAFSGDSFVKLMPPYTLPLLVDPDGKVFLPRENGFDRHLVEDFLNSLYETNIAGIETMQIAQQIEKRMQNSISQSNRQIESLNEELSSAERSLESLSSAGNSSMKSAELKKRIADLKISIQLETLRQARFETFRSRAALAAQNGRRAARSSYEIGAHMYSFVSEGIKRISAPFKGYLLGGRSVAFIPRISPVEEAEIYAADSGEDGQKASRFSWISPGFDVTEIPDANISVGGKPVVEYWQSNPEQISNPPLYLFLCSSGLFSSDKPGLLASRQTPFSFERGVIGKSQLCYYAPHAVQSAGDGAVNWSVLSRDLVYAAGEGAARAPLSPKPRWCVNMGLNEESCPALAVEFQIRTPVLKDSRWFSGIYLQDPDGAASIPLYPPLPSDLI